MQQEEGELRAGLKADLVERHSREFYGASSKSCVAKEGDSSIRALKAREQRARGRRQPLRVLITSMTNCPEYVPVIVELWPAARIPIAQI